MVVLPEVLAIEDRGLAGDRAGKRAGGKRQVTLIASEHLGVVARLLGRPEIPAALVRRNLVVSGINPRSLERVRFRIGDEVVLEGTGPCEPCAKMDTALGDGGFQAMRGHGGLTARILQGGTIRVGDFVRGDTLLPPNPAKPLTS
jgi:MOSC domain-containing protein YiiM